MTGQLSIQADNVGDEAWAADPETGDAGALPVTDLIEGMGVKDLVTVSTAAGSVVATAGHPFWSVSDAAWVDAEDLSVGDAVLEADGTETVVTASTKLTVQATVHNLTVADIHTYFVVVGDANTLVHNCGTSNVANGVRLRAQLTGEEISVAMPSRSTSLTKASSPASRHGRSSLRTLKT